MTASPGAGDNGDAVVGRPARILGEIRRESFPAEAVRSVFQPIVDLDSAAVIGFEALTRGPAGSSLESPGALFDAVGRAGRMADFDGACRDAALVTANRGGLDPPLTVFVNAEPALIEAAWESPQRETWINAPAQLRCVVELTERALTDRPASLLQAVARIRAASWGVALDVGADHRSLALMPLLRPDVVKLDLRLVQARPDRDVAQVVAAVNVYAQESGALVLAEGIETDQHLRTAIALGARLGQGWRFGRPGPLPSLIPTSGPPIPFLGSDRHPHGPTPFDLARERQPARRGSADLIRSIVEHLETLALGLGPATVVLGVQSEGRLRQNGAAGIVALSLQAALVGIAGTPQRDDRSFRGGSETDETLAGEWSLTVVAPHFSAAVLARQLGARRPDEATYEFIVTHDRQLVAACARSIAARLAPADE